MLESLMANRDIVNFKIGFLRKIAEAGIMPSDVESACITKTGGTLESLGSIAKLLTAAGIGTAITGGVAAGGIANIASRTDDEDLDEVKTQELTSEYRRLARQIRERTQRERQRKQQWA